MAKLDKVFDGDRGHINLDDYYEFKEKSDDEFKDFAIERLDEKLPAFTEGQLVRGRVGLRTVTPDCLLILGETEVKGSLCAVGFSGAGIQRGPATGQIIANFILSQTPSPYLETLFPRDFLEIKPTYDPLPFREKN
ncbi:MAG: FAD-dependent oxidoreductase [Proteobacteria bacterium]|nr:FAD-dependent oxidoreductase [Pseudomonadota bacterium]